MNRKNLTAAVLAGLAGVAGIASTAQAVNLNPDGLGQVLIYPYYTVNDGNFTILSVVNTTDVGKVVKVRFLEGKNSREVLDFNLYMSPYDVWVAAVVPFGDGAALTVPDTSCTSPTIELQPANDVPGQAASTQEFFNYAYSGDNKDGGGTGLDRGREGHFEMLNMADIIPGTSTDKYTKHVTSKGATGYGRPYGDSSYPTCTWHTRQWLVSWPGAWATIDPMTHLTTPTGGLFGNAAVVDGADAMAWPYEPAAIEGWRVLSGLHVAPGDERPNLDDGDQYQAHMFFDEDGDGAPEPFSPVYDFAVEAVTAVFMHDVIMNEYNTEIGLAGHSEWVVTFPTKRFFVDGGFAIGKPPVPPFTRAWDTKTGKACEIVYLGPGDNGIWNREEETPTPDPDKPIFSPAPPGPDVDVSELCYETNVIRFGAGPFSGTTELLGSDRVLNIDNKQFGFHNGWAQLDLTNGNPPDKSKLIRKLEDTNNDNALVGLPATGFYVFGMANTNLNNSGAVANYGNLWTHKGTRCVSDAQDSVLSCDYHPYTR